MEYKNVFIGRNPFTGRAYFERKPVKPSSSLPPEEPPFDQSSPIEVPEPDSEKMEESRNRYTNKKGRPPIGGAQDD